MARGIGTPSLPWSLTYSIRADDFSARARIALEAVGYSIPFPQQDIHIIDGKLDQAG